MGRITLEKVTKRFGDVEVIPPLDLTIEDGEFTVFVGPSGCGKSTLLRMLAGLIPADGATVDLGSGPRPLSPYPAALRARLTYVHQHPYLFRTSVRANLAYGNLGASHDQIEAVAQAAQAHEFTENDARFC